MTMLCSAVTATSIFSEGWRRSPINALGLSSSIPSAVELSGVLVVAVGGLME